jgi:hypothetical protein
MEKESSQSDAGRTISGRNLLFHPKPGVSGEMQLSARAKFRHHCQDDGISGITDSIGSSEDTFTALRIR